MTDAVGPPQDYLSRRTQQLQRSGRAVLQEKRTDLLFAVEVVVERRCRTPVASLSNSMPAASKPRSANTEATRSVAARSSEIDRKTSLFHDDWQEQIRPPKGGREQGKGETCILSRHSLG